MCLFEIPCASMGDVDLEDIDADMCVCPECELTVKRLQLELAQAKRTIQMDEQT